LFVLAIDSSEQYSCVAVIEVKEDQCLLKAEKTATTSVSASESLLPLVDEALYASGLALSEIQAFAVGVGPGSFTGIRIGMATAQTLAQVQEKPLIAVSSLKALLFSHNGFDRSDLGQNAVMVNAYQGFVFAGWYNKERQWNEEAIYPNELVESFSHVAEVYGSGADKYHHVFSTQIQTKLVPAVKITPSGLAKATTEKIYTEGSSCLCSYKEIKAKYMRPSQADINLAQHRNQKGNI